MVLLAIASGWLSLPNSTISVVNHDQLDPNGRINCSGYDHLDPNGGIRISARVTPIRETFKLAKVSAPADHPEFPRPGAKARDLASEVIHDAQRLASLEVALAKREIKDMAVANGVAAGLVAGGGLLVMLGLLVAVPTLVVVLVPWHWQAALGWVAGYVLLGIVLAVVGKARFQLGLPARTLQSLKENKEWALRRIRSNGR